MIEQYRKIARSFGMNVREDRLYVNDQVKTIGGLPLVLPTKANTVNMTTLGEDGKYHPNVELFHPLRDVVDRDNPSIKELKRSMEIICNSTMYSLTIMLVKLIETKPSDLSLELLQFLGTMDISKRVKLVVDKSLTDFLSDSSRFLVGNLTFIKTHVPRGITVKGGKVNRALTLESPLLEALEDKEKFKRDYKLNNKHVTVLTAICEYLISPWLKDNIVTFSNHGKYAGPYVILEGYKYLTEQLNHIGSGLEHLDGERAKSIHINIEYDLEDIGKAEDIDIYLPALGAVSPMTTALQQDTGNSAYIPTGGNHQTNPATITGGDNGSEYMSPEEFLAGPNNNAPAPVQYCTPQHAMPQYNTPASPTSYSSPALTMMDPRFNVPASPAYGTQINYFEDLVNYGHKMTPQDREGYYNSLSPHEKEHYQLLMERRQRDARMGTPDRR